MMSSEQESLGTGCSASTSASCIPPPSKKKRVYKSKYCTHCHQWVSKSTYYRHKALMIAEGSYSSSADSSESEYETVRESSHLPFDGNTPCLQGQDISAESEHCQSVIRLETDGIDSDFYGIPTNSEEHNQMIDHDHDEDEMWSSSDENEANDDVSTSTTHISLHEPLQYLLIFFVLWQSMFRISNAAVISLIRFVKFFIRTIGHTLDNTSITELGNNVPLTREKIHKLLEFDTEDWCVKYVVCPKCHSIYEYEDCFYTAAKGCRESKRCKHVALPDHPHERQRSQCGVLLLKKHRTKKSYQLIPHKVYPYRSLKRGITKLLNKEYFIEHCQHWKDRSKTAPNDFISDVYDGNVWKSFESSQYLADPYSYLLSLNVDWFQPFKHTTYSCGAIYLTIQNLPRTERFKQENVLLVGLMPGPHESSLSVNSYLSPLVEELKEFWGGVIIPVQRADIIVNVNVRLALTCVSCDIPASRKVCGFLGHFAKLACNKCLKEFNQHDYSGFDRDKWTPRTNETHREQAKEILKEKTKTSIQQMESKYGVRYSVLLALPYFDPVKFTVIDPMHNLYLGTGKHMYKVWIELEYLSMRSLSEIETKLKKFRCPEDIGRIPMNIANNSGGFTADQWRHWITIYSPIVLRGILPDSHLRCWLLFVRACAILQTRYSRKVDIQTADILLLQFCKKFEDIYGSNYCTPNIHLHCHIVDSIKNFGPAHAFWCYAFERYNGILESVHTNRKSIESQLLTKFCLDQEANSLKLPSNQDFLSVVPKTCLQATNEHQKFNLSHAIKMMYSPATDVQISFELNDSLFAKPLPPFQQKVLTEEMFQQIKCIYMQLYPHKEIVHLSYFYREYGRVKLASDTVGSVKPGPNSKSSSVIMAHWPSNGISLNSTEDLNVGEVQFYLKHSIKTKLQANSDIKTESHVFAFVNWRKLHQNCDWFGVSAKICLDVFEIPNACCFLPVQRIYARCAYAELPIAFPLESGPNQLVETVFVACPIPIKYSF